MDGQCLSSGSLIIIPVKCEIFIRESARHALHVLAIERAYPVLPFGIHKLGPVHAGAFCVPDGIGLELQNAVLYKQPLALKNPIPLEWSRANDFRESVRAEPGAAR
jgi:hypothetical protein